MYRIIQSVYQLLQRGYKVIGTCRNLKAVGKGVEYLNFLATSLFPNQLTLVEADLMVPGSFDAAITADCTAVFHTASPFFVQTQVMTPEEATATFITPAVSGTLVRVVVLY